MKRNLKVNQILVENSARRGGCPCLGQGFGSFFGGGFSNAPGLGSGAWARVCGLSRVDACGQNRGGRQCVCMGMRREVIACQNESIFRLGRMTLA